MVRRALRQLQEAESRRAAFNAMLAETRDEVAREGTHDLDDVLAELDAIIGAPEQAPAFHELADLIVPS